MIYLDNAATSFPKPQCVINAMTFAQRDYGANPGRGGHRLTMKAGEKVFEAREALAELFSAKSERVVFTKNCTESLNLAIKGRVKKGDHIIISSLEHNSVLRPVHRLFERNLVTYDVAPVCPLNDEETVNNFHSLINEKTRIIVCTFVSNAFGTVLPIEKIGKLCKEKGITFIVDGAQGAGTLKIDMEEMNIDILCLPCHKGLFGPLGTGAMLIGENVDLESIIEGGTGSNSLSSIQPETLPEKLESGTVNLPGIAGTLEGIKFIKRFGGEEAIHQKEMYLSKILKEDLSIIRGAELYEEAESLRKAPVVAFNLFAFHSEQVATFLDKEGIAVRAGYHCSYLAHSFFETEESGVIRVSPGVFNSKKDIKNLVFSLNRFTKLNKMC